MRKYGVILGVAIILSTLILTVGAWGTNQAVGTDGRGILFSPKPAIGTMASEAGPVGNRDLAAAAASRTVFFFPQDGPTTATVLVLLNTSNQSAKGTLAIDTDTDLTEYTLEFAPNSMYHLCSDKVLTEAGWDWADFGAGAYLGTLTLPSSIVVDGYIAWNGSGDTYDPGAAVHRLPLRFLDKPLP